MILNNIYNLYAEFQHIWDTTWEDCPCYRPFVRQPSSLYECSQRFSQGEVGQFRTYQSTSFLWLVTETILILTILVPSVVNKSSCINCLVKDLYKEISLIISRTILLMFCHFYTHKSIEMHFSVLLASGYFACVVLRPTII